MADPATNEEIVAFIELLGNLAVAECNRRASANQGFVIPSICIAQSAHETSWGKSGIMTKANAFFGIKAGGSWTGKIYVADTWEVAENGEAYNTVANFRAYDSLEDSVADYYNLIVNNSRYAGGVSYWGNIKTPSDTINAIWSGGYATDSNYPADIMEYVNGRDLGQWDSRINPANATPGGSSGSGSTPGFVYIPPTGEIDTTGAVKFKFEKI